MIAYLDARNGLSFRRPGNWKSPDCETPILVDGHPFHLKFDQQAPNPKNFHFSAVSGEGYPIMCGNLEISGLGPSGNPVPLSKAECEHLKRHVRTLSVLGTQPAAILVDAELL